MFVCFCFELAVAEQMSTKCRHIFVFGEYTISNDLSYDNLCDSFLFIQFSSVQLLSSVWIFETPWPQQARPPCPSPLPGVHSNSISIELVMPFNHRILCCPLLLLPSVFPSIRVFSNESALHIRWPKYWSFSFSISPHWSPLGWTGWISLLSRGLSRVFSNTTVQKHQFIGTRPSLRANSHICTWLLEKP